MKKRLRHFLILLLVAFTQTNLLAQTYTWGNVEITAGGFVPGIVFHPAVQDVAYLRTDIGGAYRLNGTTRRWEPITDLFDATDWNMYGVESIALDSTDANKVYLALGTYAYNNWAGNGAILRSSDKGQTWSRTDLTFKLGANEDGRGMGERLVVDRHKPNILFLGTRQNGLWKSTDSGVTWAQVTSFPTVTTIKDAGLGFVVMDGRTGTAGNATQTIYVGVARTGSTGANLYKSTNGGTTWTAVSGAPLGALIPYRAVLSANGMLYLTYNDATGPNGVTTGEVWRLNTGTGVWTRILTPGTAQGGFGGIALDRSSPNTIMVATIDRWWPNDEIYRTTDGGTTWKTVGTGTNVTRDASASPYMRAGAANDNALTTGNWVSALAIDPFNSNRVIYGTGAAVWGCDNIKTADTGGNITWVIRGQGVEETAVLSLASPPSGPSLISGTGDICGFVHTDITKSPATGMIDASFQNGMWVDFAETTPAKMVMIGHDYTPTQMGTYSTNAGVSWTKFSSVPSGATDGMVAMSANGGTIIWAPTNSAPYRSTNNGTSWAQCAGIGGTATLVSDRVNANKFYAIRGTTLYRSTDGGANFAAGATSGFAGTKLKAVPGLEDNLWVPSSGGLYRSTNGGVSFTKNSIVQSADVVGFGKAATSQTHPAIFITGKISNVYGIYRSDDIGVTWVRINDNLHQFGNISTAITGDPRVFGRVYVATNGRGIVLGDVPTNQLPTVSITAPTTNTVYTAPAATITLTATAADADGTISKVEFYNGTTILNTDNASPYTYNWTSVAAGTYTITAKATDDKGAVTTSTAITIIVDQAPAVSITAPVDNQIYVAPATVIINATATDADGTISKVEFYNGTTLLSTDNASPYAYSWTSVGSGTYTLTAKATDDDGVATTSSVITIVVNPNLLPVVSITAPATNTVYTAPAASIPLTATASDLDGTVSKVDFYNGTTLLGTDNSSPYAYNWTAVAAGTYTITAKATDDKGGVTTSSSITVIVDQAPVVSITSPANNATFVAPASITINATATDADGTISKVEFYNGTTLLSTDNASPYTYSWTNVGIGTYSLTAVATDNNGVVTTSSVITIVVNANTLPTVSISAPANNAVYAGPAASITLTAAAADADGTISKVEFYNGTTLLTTDNAIPYTYNWTTVAAGNYTITAKATDDKGGVTTSSPITVIVDQAPAVSITSPANNASFVAPASVTINATATDADGTVSKVEFYNGTTLLSSDIASPYSYTWTSVGSGTYNLTAVATDNNGIATTSSVVAIIVSNNALPTVSITAPANNTVYTAPVATIALTATAADADGTVSKVEFYSGTTLLTTDNTSPYSYNWTSVVAGTYTITAKATDDKGAVTTSNAITVIVDQAPTVSITSPANNATFVAPASVTINATATDADGTINKVEFYNGTTLLSTDNATPYTYNWTSLGTGTYSITAVATDNNGIATTSTPIAITVNPNQLPTVSVTGPASNTVYTAPAATIALTATAADADGTVSKVEFYNGTTLLSTDNTSPYSYNWTTVAAGTYTITVKATDDKGGVTTSSSITVIVDQAPVVSITSPASNAVFVAPASVTINATATDADGAISKVEFYNGTTLLSTENASPYSYAWTSVGTGSYSLIAVATDNNGVTTTSSAISITVNTNQLPTVSITAPATNTVYTAPATSITLNATAADVDGTISKVEFYNGTTLLNTDNASPYSYNWASVAAGTYTITAKATDDKGSVTTSSSITVIVDQAPVVSITSPVNNTTFVAPASVTINANATDTDGTISKVEFYNGTTLLSTDNSLPYSYTWTSVGVGTYSLTAVATDNNGVSTTSSVVAIIVGNNQPPVVSLSAPVNNTVYTAPASTIPLAATASDADGTITKVEFFNGTTLLNTDNSSPYSYNWGNVAAGTYSITAKATDDKGTVTTSSVISVIVDLAPSVSITSPANNTSFVAPASVTFNATANDADGTVSIVEFYNGTTLLGTSTTAPYTYTWTGIGNGTYNITAKATDNNGVQSTSTIVKVIVNSNQSSVISINTPVQNALVNVPGSVDIGVTASDPDGSITKVEYYDGTTLVGTSTTAPYNFTWVDPTPGAHTLTVKVTDSNGGVTTSSPVSITVNQLPVVDITSPSTTVTMIGTSSITIISASASDADGTITKVEFYNGSTLLGTSNAAPYSYNFSNKSIGTYVINAKATDNKGAVVTSQPITITVIDNQPSVISITSPVANDVITGAVNMTLTATDPDGTITKVEFYDGATLLGTSTTAPYDFTWSSPSNGSHSITAKVTDSNGGVTTSSPILFTSANNTATGVLGNSNAIFTSVYPNPSRESFIVKSGQEIKSLWVMDMYGKTVTEIDNIGQSQQIEIGKDLAEGTYVLMIQYMPDKVEVAKLVKVE